MFFTPERLDFNRDGKAWPLRDCSLFVKAFGMQWHVQQMGAGEETLVFVHGTGASAHSWRAIMPILSEKYRVIAFDLPGQGFTDPMRGADPTVPTMAAAVQALFDVLGLEKPFLIGHSAGAALSLQVALCGHVPVKGVVSINGALYPFPGMGAAVFPMLAKILFLNPVVPYVFALSAGGKDRVDRLLEGTGSKLDEEGLALYRQLLKNPSHVRSTLAWMANWDLEPLVVKMSELDIPFLQIIGSEDETIAPENAAKTAKRIKQAETVKLPGFGHLVHEEEPLIVSQLIKDFVEKT